LWCIFLSSADYCRTCKRTQISHSETIVFVNLQMRPHLRASLHLITMVLPKSFLKHIADRMACGLAIILRASYHYFETPNEWAFMGDTLDMLANYSSARLFVFDGIASTVEFALPESSDYDDDDGDVGDRPIMLKDATEALARILIRFVLGFYQGDMTLTVPAMLCLEKVYRHKVDLLLQAQAPVGTKDENDTAAAKVLDSTTAAPDKDFWQNVAVAVYSVCRSSDSEVSDHGLQCYQRIICTTAVSEIPDEKWIAIMYLMVNKQPPVVADISRANTFDVLGQLMMAVVPELSHRPDNYDDLVDLISQVSGLARENLRDRQGRRGNVSPLFEKTVQIVTYISNYMLTDEWKGEPEFSAWASETLLAELEKVGAAGASLKNQAAVKPSSPQHDNDDHEDDDEEEDDGDEAEGDLSEEDETETEYEEEDV
jgi:hypothetical protein